MIQHTLRDGTVIEITIAGGKACGTCKGKPFAGVPRQLLSAERKQIESKFGAGLMRLDYLLIPEAKGQEILAAIESEVDSKALRIAALFPGLNEIMQAREQEERYQDAFDRMMASGSSILKASLPTISSDNLRAQYPAAAAYLLAKAYSRAEHYAKSAAGDNAVARLEAGEDYQIVIADMQAEWSAAAERSVYNA